MCSPGSRAEWQEGAGGNDRSGGGSLRAVILADMKWKTIPGFLLAIVAGLFWSQVVFTLLAVVRGVDMNGDFVWPNLRSLVILTALASAATWGAYRLCRAK